MTTIANIWPAEGETVLDHLGNTIPVGGLTVLATQFYKDLLRAGRVLDYDPTDAVTTPTSTLIGLDVLNVKDDYGAAGDGVTDDTAAVQAAVTAGPIVYFPPGTYLVGRILVPSNRTLCGAGFSSVLKLKASSNSALLVNSTWGVGNTNIHIHDLKLDGNKANNTYSAVGATHAVAFLYCTRSSVRRCWIVDTDLDGVYIGANFTYSGTAIGGGCQFIDINDNRIERTDRNGVSVTWGTDITIANNDFNDCNVLAPSAPTIYGAGTIDIEPNNPSNTTERINIIGNRIYNSHHEPIACAGSPIIKDIVISNNICHSATDLTSGKCGIDIGTKVTRCTISGNLISGSCGNGIKWGTDSVNGAIVGNVVTCDGTTITGTSAAVLINDGASEVSVIGNHLSGFTIGVSINGSTGAISDVTVIGNNMETTGAANYIVPRSGVTGLVAMGNNCGTGVGTWALNLDDPGASFPMEIGIGQVSNAHNITKHCTGTLAWNPGSVADGAVDTTAVVTVTGAVVGNTVTVGFTPALPAGVILFGAVTAADTVTVTMYNRSGAPVDLNGTLRVDTWAH